MEEEMSDVWIGSYKLFIAIARFVDGETITKPSDVKKGKEPVTTQTGKTNPNFGGGNLGAEKFSAGGSGNVVTWEGRSFLDSLLNRNKVDVILVDDVMEAFSQWNGLALVGAWSADAFGFRPGFDVIGSRYGRMLKSACMSVNDIGFSYTYIGVLSKCYRRIKDRIDISWRGTVFNVWVDEDEGEWLPNCVEEVDDDYSLHAQENENAVDYENVVNSDKVRVEEGEIPVEEVLVHEKVNQDSADIPTKQGGEAQVDESSEVKASSRKKFWRKSLYNHRGESSGSLERPKKHLRDENDIFGLDKIIGIMS
ncbi:hypothetical protein Hanom_Chr15g01406991 [Helianthus anomalus]